MLSLERESAVADVVLVEEREPERGGDGAGQGGLACARVALHRYDEGWPVLFHCLSHLFFFLLFVTEIFRDNLEETCSQFEPKLVQ